jgi:ATP-dependent helicase/nuclease subunit B
MDLRREFLGCQRPPLPLAADFLLQRYSHGASCDMAAAIVVLPGSRAARRLLEIFVERAEQRSLHFTPPKIETVGHLPEQLYRPQKPFATALVQQLAWAEVLRTAPAQQLAPILASPPPPEERGLWLELGQLLARQHTELAADGLDFADVARRGAEVDGFDEAARWQTLRQIQVAYLKLLDELGLWDIQTARLVAIERQECATDREIFLVGAVDLNVAVRRMLDQVADRVTALVFAPDDWVDRFDQHGCLIPEAWEAAAIAVRTEQVHVVDGPAEQADRVARCLAAYQGRYRPDEITIGLADEQITPHIQRKLRECQVATRSAAGIALAQTAPYRLLDAVADYLQRSRVAEFAALVRHPDLDNWLEQQGLGADWLEQLDAYFAEHLPGTLDDEWLGGPDVQAMCRKVWQRVEKLVRPLREPVRSLAEWSEPLRELLRQAYGEQTWDREVAADRVPLQALEAINDVLHAHAEAIPLRLMPALPAAEALRLALVQLQSVALAAPVDPAALELLGWLELPWDDAPALIVTTLNEGHVPSSINSDLFLPNALRSRLGLPDNVRRYARDAYALSLLLATRQRVDLIVARRNGEGDPLAPSRLLFATDAETLAQRALTLFRPPHAFRELPPLAGRLSPGRAQPAFPVPRPRPLAQPITSLRVTAFRDYLACRYRFYLRHVLQLQTIGDGAEELDGAAFGGLLHVVLNEFGRGPCQDSTDPEEIRAVLSAALDRCVQAQYGRRPLASVCVQREQLRARLSAFAEQQAAWAARGWRIELTEVPAAGQSAAWNVDGQPFFLRGRIDRIDVHQDSGQRFIFDYKSSDAGKTPQQVHQRSGEWVDLQLPLYRHLAQVLGITSDVKLGYILLPKDVGQVGFYEAEWTADDLAVADEVARGVIRDIRSEVFWPPVEPPPDFSEEFAAICQDGVFERTMDQTGEPK